MSKELEALKGIKQAIAKHLHKQTGVSVEKHFEYLKNDTEISIIEQALNELEELKQEVIARQETENSLTQWVADLTTELTELKSWRDELSGTIQDLISKAKHWEEKENKTDFEKGIARGYKTMLHQLLVSIDFDKEKVNEKKHKRVRVQSCEY